MYFAYTIIFFTVVFLQIPITEQYSTNAGIEEALLRKSNPNGLEFYAIHNATDITQWITYGLANTFKKDVNSFNTTTEFQHEDIRLSTFNSIITPVRF